jgi:menaquinol-cytochrome c reductase iron-sulfur subunit
MNNSEEEENTSRRKFIRVATVGVSAACGLFPVAAGVAPLLDPVQKSAGSGGDVPWSKVAPLDSLPNDGSPAKFEVVQEKVVDAWTTYQDVPVGAVYLSRSGNEVTAFNLKCPHLGCAIDFRKQSNDYFCPCHNSSFALDGSVTTENSPSPRSMDTMETKVEKGQVWIRFQHFRPNIPEKKPLA